MSKTAGGIQIPIQSVSISSHHLFEPLTEDSLIAWYGQVEKQHLQEHTIDEHKNNTHT